jgi:hypothetical protein
MREAAALREWPSGQRFGVDRVGVVMVSYNTVAVTAQAVYAVLHTIRTPELRLVVVDNASTDGSAELLTALADAGLCEVIANREQRYHGPALTQAMDYLAATQTADGRVDAVWVLDSDCIVLRPDTVRTGVELMAATGAGMVGQWSDDRWNRPGELLGLHCLLIDPAQVWRNPVVPFEEDGSPSQRLQDSARRAGVTVAELPFTRDGYVVHLGRTTLRALLHNDERGNRYFDWARTHAEPHFMEEPEAPQRYETFLAQFAAEVGRPTAEHLIAACQRSGAPVGGKHERIADVGGHVLSPGSDRSANQDT